MRVRYRVDGVLHETARVPADDLRGRLARQAHGRHGHRREAHPPGRADELTVGERKVDLRVTTLPTRVGEGCTIRILDRNRRCARLTSSGWPAAANPVRRRVHTAERSDAGDRARRARARSTTLYAALPELNDVERNIITIEDPVEYRDLRRQPDAREPESRAHLRERPARDPARGPGRDHGRRDPRRGDGPDLDPGGADGPHGAHDAAHQRRARRRSHGSARWASRAS